MPSQIVHRNRPVWRSSDYRVLERSRTRAPSVRNRRAVESAEPVDCARAIPADDARSIFRAGIALRDDDEDLVYRVVNRVDPTQGWASTDFWQDRYKIEHPDVIDLARLGYLDPVIVAGSQVRRYRCRDEVAMKKQQPFKAIKHRVVDRRSVRRKREAIKVARAQNPKPWRR